MNFSALGTLNHMKRNMKGTYDLNRVGNDRQKENTSLLESIYAIVRDQSSSVKQFMFHIKMSVNDISEFFPLESDAALEKFLNRSDPEWERRRNGFYHLLYNAVTNQKKRFAAALLHLLFTRDYVRTHKWPMSGG